MSQAELDALLRTLKEMNDSLIRIRNLIVLLTAICFALAVVAFFLPHGVGTVCAIGTVALAALVLILCLAYGLLYFGQKHTAA